jgi:primosomal protein N''
MAELQQRLRVVKTEERYEPTFSYRWDLLDAWLPEAVEEARAMRREEAIDRVLGRYLGAAAYSTEALLARLFALSRAEVDASIARLSRRGRVRGGCAVPGWRGRWLIAEPAGRA